MKMWKISSIGFVFLIGILTACSTGYMYNESPELKFSELNYGYKVHFFGDKPKMAYLDEGNKNAGKTLVLIHGLASNAGYFREVIPELAKYHRVIVVDLPGYGHSEKGDFPYGMKWYAEQIRGLIQGLELKNVVISGHSMGGQIAMTFALNWPSEINKLALLSPAGVEPFKKGEGDWLKSVITIEGTMKATEEQVRVNVSRNFYEWDSKFEWLIEERMRLAKSKIEFREYAYTVDQCVDAMLLEPTTERLHEIQVPVTFIYGKHDGLIPNPYLHPGFTADVFKKGAELMREAKLIEIPKAGHMLQIEQPELVAKAILESM